MAEPVITDTGSETRTRLLQAAGEVFAEVGFKTATVRDICQRAGANIAAVNYHFGDKEKLYSAVLRYAHTLANEPDAEQYRHMTVPADEKLRLFIRDFLMALFSPGRPGWHQKLFAREMVEPSIGLEELIRETARPRRTVLAELVAELAIGRGENSWHVLCAESIVGQCLFYYHARPVLTRLDPGREFKTPDIERLAAHIAEFSISAIQAHIDPSPGGRNATRRKPD